jgi:hypothetical protein
MRAAQLTFDGREEAPALESGGFWEFRKVSVEEDGLFLPAQAAIALDVHPSRVLQLMDVGIFRTWHFFGKRYLSCREVGARRQADVKTGRPRKSVAQRVKGTVKMLAMTDAHQAVSVLVE